MTFNFLAGTVGAALDVGQAVAEGLAFAGGLGLGTTGAALLVAALVTRALYRRFAA